MRIRWENDYLSAIRADRTYFCTVRCWYGHMSYRHFAVYNVVGALVWVLLFTYSGYFFGGLPVVQENLKLLIMAINIISILPGIIEIWRATRQQK